MAYLLASCAVFRVNCKYGCRIPFEKCPDVGTVAPLFANLIETTDAPDTTATGYSMGLGDTFSGAIYEHMDDDWIAVTLVAGQAYAISMSGQDSDTGTLQIPYLSLMNDTGFAVADDNYSGPGNDAFIRFTATVSGTYYINAGTRFVITGTYQITFNLAIPEGGAGNDVIYGNAATNHIVGNGGHDWLLGGDGGSDILLGGDGNDNLRGDAGNDALYGGDGNDNLIGANGNDRLEGGTGNDVMRGGNGNDVFVFGASSGADTITDFSDNVDTIRFTDAAVTFASLSITYAGGNATVDYGSGTILLNGIAPGTLTASDFDFV